MKLGFFHGLDWETGPAMFGVALNGFSGKAQECRFNTHVGFAIARKEYPEAFAAFEKGVGVSVIADQEERTRAASPQMRAKR